MAINRPLATLLAAISLLLATVAAIVVLGDARPRPATPAAGGADDAPRQRERMHARQQRRAAEEPQTAVEQVPTLDPPLRLPWLPGSGFVLGTVTDAVSGDAVPDANVRLMHPTGEEIAATVTDHAGHYQIEQVPESLPLVLRLTHSGHLTGLCCDVRVSGADILRKDVALLRAPRVTLQLTALPQERAAEGVLVRLMDGPREIARGISDVDGALELAAAEQGRFQLRCGGVAWAPNAAEDLLLLPGRGDVELRRAVYRGGGLEFAVKDLEGEPVSGATVSVHGGGLEPVCGVTGGEGELSLGPFLPDISLRATVQSADGSLRAAVPVRTRDGHIDPVEVTVRPTGRVAGVVVAPDGRELRNATIEIVVPEDGAPLGSVAVGADGRFVVTGLPPGDVEIVVRAPGHVESRSRAQVGDSRGLLVRMQTAPSGTLVGQVLGPRRAPVPGAVVRVVPGDVQTRTEDDGSFVLEGVPADTPQRVIVEAQGMQIRESARADRLLVTLADEQRMRLELQMTVTESQSSDVGDADAAIRAVTGRVVRGNGLPVAAAVLTWAGLSAVSGADGSFRLERPEDDRRMALPVLTITPPAGLLEPTTLPLERPSEDGLVAVSEIGLRDRPSCLLDLSGTPHVHEGALTFALLIDTEDELLGVATEPFESRRHVTYDGSWLHVAPSGAWERGGHRLAWVGVTSGGGPVAAAATWPSAAGARPVVAPEWRDGIAAVEIPIPKGYRGGRVRLRLTEPPSSAPIERLGLPIEFELQADTGRLAIPALLMGTWTADLLGPEASALPTLRTTITNGRARGFRPAR